MDRPGIRLELDGHVATLRIDNPARRNALTLAMWRDLAARCDEIAAHPDARVLVIRGAGQVAFSAGADISEFREVRRDQSSTLAYDAAYNAAEAAIAGVPIPTVAAVNGQCFGGGFGIAMACDLRFAVDSARFAVPAAKLGLGYNFDSVRSLVGRLDPATVADILFSARTIEAAEAMQLGIVQSVWASDVFDVQVRAYVETLATNAPLSLRSVKRALIELRKPDAAQDVAAAKAAVAACQDSDDYHEGPRAFMEKRKPEFRGR